uniref:Uncharacterized protein n=1 Tax=Piliocolobus tephrosceles TaxID=591936 RepID=A0A8C9M005_9PRIM
MKMPPGVGLFGTGSSTQVLLSLLRAEGFTGETLWGKTEEEAKQLAASVSAGPMTSCCTKIRIWVLGRTWFARTQQHQWMPFGW